MALVQGTDGLPAREVHEWSDEKLFYVERYMDIFSTGMKSKFRLVYADFFSGPGLCIDEETRRESLGSPLRAAARSGFDALVLNDADPEAIEALNTRLATVAHPNATVLQMDCNDAVLEARRILFPSHQARSTLGLAFVDPTGFQMDFDSIQRLTAGIRMDLIITFMSGYIRRFGQQEDLAGRVDAFMGTDRWRAAAGSTRGVLDIYEDQLRGIGFDHVDDDIRIVNSRESTIYHLVFASKNPRGIDFFRKISRRTYKGQQRML